LPFEAETVGDLIVQIMTKEPKPMRELNAAIPQSLSDMVAQAMSKSREQRFSDARAMRRALLAAAESALPVGRRMGASLRPAEPVPPPPAGLAALASGALTEVDAVPAGRAADAQAGGATWGDFEGLNSPRIVDDSLPPANRSPALSAPGPQQERVVARLGDALELDLAAPEEGIQNHASAERTSGAGRGAGPRAPGERTSAERSSGAGRNRKSAKQASPNRAAALDVALDPLYAGAEQAAPEIDYGPAGPSVRKAQPQAGPAPRARRRPRPESPQPRTAYKRSFFPWLLPVAALLLVGYMLWKPSVGALSASGSEAGSSLAKGAADSGLTYVRLLVKARRESPAKAPPHMRDVVF
jgi:hypothetical protein